jgi:hypothetical protein
MTTNRYIMCRQRAGLAFVVIFSKRPAGQGKGLRGPCVEDPWFKVWSHTHYTGHLIPAPKPNDTISSTDDLASHGKTIG